MSGKHLNVLLVIKCCYLGGGHKPPGTKTPGQKTPQNSYPGQKPLGLTSPKTKAPPLQSKNVQ